MTQFDPLQALPTRRIRAVDGMAVTAEVWEEAHNYHRQHQELHALLAHGAGIVSGLNVIASDPPDSAVYVTPGIAIDPSGRLIVLGEPLAYDVGSVQEGPLYLLLTYGESRPRPNNGHVVQEGAPLFVHAEFGLEAVASLPKGSHVELARLRRQGQNQTIGDADDAAAPGANEIDLRFRRQISPAGAAPASLAVAHVGGSAGQHGRGAHYLARALRAGGQPAWVDDNLGLGASLAGYGLVCLVGHGAFRLTPDEMNTLYAFTQGGGTLFIESCRRDAKAAKAADASFEELLQSLGIRLEAVEAGHGLLSEPALFAALPAGYETDAGAGLRAGPGVVFSTADFGCLWQGERRGRPATREEIRAGHEFGGNLVAWAGRV